MTAALALGWLLAINAATLFAFRSDKDRARTNRRRISERSLLTLALLGGSPGALFARRRFRHKTRKQPFGAILLAICAVQIGVAVVLGVSRS